MSQLSDRTPGGAQTRSKQHHVFGGKPFPQTADWAKGSKVHAEGRTYIDWMAALASVGLGYGNGHVNSVVEQPVLDGGVALPLPSKLEYEVADLLCSVLKWPEQVRWVKTGSEATAAAMMIARRATGRKKVVSIGYHGWHEAHLPSANLIDVPWGYEQTAHEEVDCDTAAVLLEPMRDHDETPDHLNYAEGYVRRVHELCNRTGALLIMDEMVTGFRWALGGASEYFGITPDLATYGKAMANGYPLACVVGGRKLMKHALDVSSTFGGECVGLAAAKATIEVYQRWPVIAHLWEVGRKLQAGVPQLKGWPVHPWLDLGEDQRIAVVQACAKEGVLMHPAGMNPMYAHTDDDVSKTIAVLIHSLSRLA